VMILYWESAITKGWGTLFIRPGLELWAERGGNQGAKGRSPARLPEEWRDWDSSSCSWMKTDGRPATDNVGGERAIDAMGPLQTMKPRAEEKGHDRNAPNPFAESALIRSGELGSEGRAGEGNSGRGQLEL
jgi:hypothetical protein